MSKKVLFIGDVHGLAEWRELALDGLKSFYEIVFLGDYVDSYHVRPVVQIENLKAIIAFKRKKKNAKITLLLGNHDYAYIHGYSQISGYQHPHAYQYRKLFQDNMDLFQIAWGYFDEKGKYTLATHAGLTHKYWGKHIIPEFQEKGFIREIEGSTLPSQLPIHETLNYLKDKKNILWKIGPVRQGSGTPGPLWADYTEFMDDPYPDINQVFGHTPKVSVTIDKSGDNFYACVDSWGNKKQASLVLSL